MEIGERIKQLRDSRGWSQGDLARKCGWKRQARISNYEKGRDKGGREPDFEAMKAIARAFDISLSELLESVGSNGLAVREPGPAYHATQISKAQKALLERLQALFEKGDLTDSDVQSIRGYVAALLSTK